MRQLEIIRIEQTEEGAIGVLVIDGKVFCFTLMPDITDKHFQIPAGHYKCKRFHGKKWADTFEIIVEGHSALLFHSGNTEEDTLGCTLLGEEIGYLEGKRAVLASGKAFVKFMEELNAEQELDLHIIDFYAEVV